MRVSLPVKINEDSDLNKLLQLKKQELEVDLEYQQLKQKLNKKTKENEEKDKALTIKYNGLLEDLQQNELQVIEKLQLIK